VTIRPAFSGTVPEHEICLKNSAPDPVPVFLFFQIHSVLLIIFFRMETFLLPVSDFSDKEMVKSASHGTVKNNDMCKIWKTDFKLFFFIIFI
jgi:hypothetical protein